IPYSDVVAVTIEQRVVGTGSALLGGLNSRQLNVANNIHITMDAPSGELVLRLEMISGVSVMGQAKKCQELMDRLLTLGIRQKFRSAQEPHHKEASEDPLTQLERLAELRDKGI